MRETEDSYWDNGDDSNGDHGKCFQQQVLFIHDPYLNNQSSKPKTRRRRWTQKDMTNAFNAVKCTGMSLRGAASHYNVPESTLRDRVHGRVSLDCSRPGPPTFFTYEEEKKMVDHILFMSKIGYPYTRNQVVELAGDMTKAVDRIAPFKFLNPSQAWFYAFLNRWPDLKNYLYGPRSNRKSKGVSAESIQAYYDNLDKVLTKYDIKNKPENIWMTDEVSIACDNSNIPKILPITIQRPQSNTYWNPTAAVLGAGNAAGDKIPAFLMFKASEISNEMMEGTLKGSKFATSNNGWVNADAFIQWYERHFRPLITQRPVILLYDGHLQFVTVRVLEKAKEDNVLLFPLPPHPPYNHCVESSCFAAYPKYFNKRIQKFHDDFKRNVNKSNVSKVICQAYEWALQPINLISIFFKLGICPYNNLSNNLAPYMPDNYDDFGNYENMENVESDYSHYDSPIDRSYTHDDSYMPLTPISHHQTLLSNLPNSTAYNNLINQSSNNNNIISTTTIENTTSPNNDSPTKFYPQSSSVFSASTNNTINNTSNNSFSNSVKVLDNMASKAMNQIHAQRSEFNSKFMPLTTSNLDHNNQIVPLKLDSSNSRNSMILRNNNSGGNNVNSSNIINKLSNVNYHQLQSQNNNNNNNFHQHISSFNVTNSSHNPIKLITSSSSVSSSDNITIAPISQMSQYSNMAISAATNSTPIKLIKSSNNVIIKANSNCINSSNNNRPLIRLHSINSDEPINKKSKVIMSKSENFIKYGESNCKTINTIDENVSKLTTIPNITTGSSVVYNRCDAGGKLDLGELMEVKHDMVVTQESDEINQTCNVCGCVEPPGLSQVSENDELVVDWARCDFCLKWVHLQPCCDSRCVQSDNRFKCIICIRNLEVIEEDDDDECDEVEEDVVVEIEQLKDESMCEEIYVTQTPITLETEVVGLENSIKTANNQKIIHISKSDETIKSIHSNLP